ncbi:MAG: flagellar protein FlgN [Oscillospiraceae bacterium]|nr:flagellar protein FlgN [Oscillospiraceae bacterium]
MELNGLVARFMSIMRQEKDIYSKLLGLSKNKKEAIFSKETDELDAIVREEHGLLLRLEQAEKRRMRCVEMLVTEIGCRPEDVTMMTFADHGTVGQADDLQKLHTEMGSLLKQLEEFNAENHRCLESRLEYVRFAMDVLEPDNDPGVYGTDGTNSDFSDNPARPGIIDRKV